MVCPQIVSQAPQHFRPSEKQTICEGCFVRQSVCSVVSLNHYGTSRAVHLQQFWKMNDIVQELCESRGGRPGLSVLKSLLVSVDVRLY